MIIENRRLEYFDNKLKVSATVDGFSLWYQVPGSYKVSGNGEPFLAASIFPAMLKGERIDVDPDLPVSDTFINNLGKIQEIFHSWNPDLKIVDINATRVPPVHLNDGVISFFSGGVDSSYSFVQHLDEITHAIYISGFDFPCGDSNFEGMIERNKSLTERYNKIFVNVETNFYQFGYIYNLSRNLTQGSCLGSIALLLGFTKVIVPSSYSYSQLFPLGSHPLTDPLWSNGSYDIVHDGCEATRTEKIKRLISEDAIMASLSVCLHDVNNNCGKCPKCLRTMVSLHLMNGPMAAFPPLPGLTEIARKKIDGTIEATFLKENIDLADKMGRRDLKKALERSLRRYEMISLLRHADKVLLNGNILDFYKKWIKKDGSIVRIDLCSGKD